MDEKKKCSKIVSSAQIIKELRAELVKNKLDACVSGNLVISAHNVVLAEDKVKMEQG